MTTWIPASAGMTVIPAVPVSLNKYPFSAPRTPHLALLALLIFSNCLSAQAPTDPIQEIPKRVKKVTLKNGLRALIVERPTSPTVSFSMYIRTGGLDDDGGKSGLAHMFEHMLFKGTKTIGTKDYSKEARILDQIDELELKLQKESDKRERADQKKIQEIEQQITDLEKQHSELSLKDEFWQIYEQAGAEDINASTGYDFTNYHISLPVNQLKLWMVMEADRIENPVLREFYKERGVVLEERRMRIDNSPQGRLWEGFLAAAFMAHPYGRPIIGWESDISRVTRADAHRFFQTHYDISRLVVGIVGGIKADEVEALLKKHFEGIPSKPSESANHVTEEPAQEGERRIVIEFDSEPTLILGYHRPNMVHPDSSPLAVASEILSSGRSSRFYRNIVEKKRIAVSAWAESSAPGERAEHLFVAGGTPRDPHTVSELEQAIYEEVEILKRDGPTPAEMEKVKNSLEASLIRGLSSNLGLANQLAYYESVAGDWALILHSLEDIRRVTADDVKRVLAKYMTTSNRTVATLKKRKAA